MAICTPDSLNSPLIEPRTDGTFDFSSIEKNAERQSTKMTRDPAVCGERYCCTESAPRRPSDQVGYLLFHHPCNACLGLQIPVQLLPQGALAAEFALQSRSSTRSAPIAESFVQKALAAGIDWREKGAVTPAKECADSCPNARLSLC